MNDLTTTSILALFETNKEQRQSFMIDLMGKLENGEVDPLKIHFHIKCIDKILDELTNTDEKKNKDGFHIAKRYKELVLDAAEKYGQKEFSYMGAKIKIGEVGTKYDYSKCNDPEILELQEKATELKEKIEKKTKFLQALPAEGVTITNEETGETYKVYPAAKSSTTFITMTLK
jgi:hypothetical protein